MEKQDMKFRIKEVLDERTPDILNNIKNSSAFKVPIKQKKTLSDYVSFKSLSYSLATVFILAILVTSLMMSGPSAPVVASTVTLDINPSIEITLDENDFVINVIAINDDGETIISRDIVYKGLTLDQAIEYLIESAHNKGFIVETTEENVILIRVNSDNAEMKARIEAALVIKIHNEVSRYAQLVRVINEKGGDITPDELRDLVEIAQTHRISVAKLLLINKIIEIDDTHTIEELKTESIRNLYALHYRLLSPPTTVEDYTPRELNELIGAAREHQISVAKLVIINNIIEIDDSYLISDLKELSLRELSGIHYSLLDTIPSKGDSPGNNN